MIMLLEIDGYVNYMKCIVLFTSECNYTFSTYCVLANPKSSMYHLNVW